MMNVKSRQTGRRVIVLAMALWALIAVTSSCTKKDVEEAAEDSANAVEKAYDKTTGVMKNAVEGVNKAVYQDQ